VQWVVADAAGAAALLARGEAGRRVRETALNEASSRSHVVMQVGHEDPCAVTRTPSGGHDAAP
jgi:hypothetical protein